MAQRPIIWAAGTAALVVFGAVSQGTRLAGMVSPSGGESFAMSAESRRAPAAPQPAQPGSLTVSADYRGHYLVHPTIENYRVKMLVDTGASVVALTAADARALGISPAPRDYRVQLSTANGRVRGAQVTLREIRLGSILVRNVEAVVLPEGALSISLLGNSFLHKLKGYEVQTGRMVLRG